MAAGRPVAAVRVGGVPELVRDGSTGRLVEPGDAAGLARAVDRLLADPVHAAELGENARRRAVAEHGCRELARRLGRLYEDDLYDR